MKSRVICAAVLLLLTTAALLYADRPAPKPAAAEWEHPNEGELIEAALLARANRIEDCTVTYYCFEKYAHICGTGDGLTALGTEVMAEVSCAVDPRVIPLGSTVMVDYGDGELHYYIAEDVGGAVTGKHVDLAVSDHQTAMERGVVCATVYWVGA